MVGVVLAHHGTLLTGLPGSGNTIEEIFVTRHTHAKLRGGSSINGVCHEPCNFAGFCYARRMERYRPRMMGPYKKNDRLLREGPLERLPLIGTYFCRFFSIGSCNGDKNTLENIKAICQYNDKVRFALWVEPVYWDIAYSILGNVANLKLVFSNKGLNTIMEPAGEYNTYNVLGQVKMDELKRGKTTICNGSCSECGWQCYTRGGLTIVEKMRLH